MRIGGIVVAATLLALTGCQSLRGTGTSSNVSVPEKAEPVEIIAKIDNVFCLLEQAPEDFEFNCDVKYWLNVWIDAANTPWVERKQQMNKQGDSIFGLLHDYLLTLPTDTPYQDRLRAQLAVNDIADSFTPSAKQAISIAASDKNIQLMRLESALVVLEKENTARGEKLKVLEDETKNLRKKLEELLQIEATLMDKNRSTQQ